MTYRQLKEAGYPLKSVSDEDMNRDQILIGKQWYFAPTLSELIEACGTDFKSLVLGILNFKWICYSRNGSFDTIGKSPEETVAKLWLKLNTKK